MHAHENSGSKGGDAPLVSPRVFDAKNAASYVGVSQRFLDKARVHGGGPRFCKLGARVVYRPEDLDAWLEQNIRRSTSEVVA